MAKRKISKAGRRTAKKSVRKTGQKAAKKAVRKVAQRAAPKTVRKAGQRAAKKAIHKVAQRATKKRVRKVRAAKKAIRKVPQRAVSQRVREVAQETAERDILNSLKQGVVLGDGGNVEEARIRGYSTPKVILEFPNVVRLIHQDFFRAGAQVLRAMTRGATRTHLEQRGNWGGRMEEINRTATRLAKEVAGDEAFVAGCLGPTGVFNPEDAGSADRAWSEWEEQVAVMTNAGVDLLICESFDRLDEARLALTCCKRASLPTMATVDFPLKEEATRDGASPAECALSLVDDGADVVGLSGIREPEDMWPVVLKMRGAVNVPIAFLPSGYRTSRQGWESVREAMLVYGMEMARYALQAKVHGINYIGGSDGAGPRLIRSMAQALGCERVHIELRPR